MMNIRALFEELFNDDEGIACVHVRPFSDHDLLHDAFLWCLQFILHLHGFYDNYPLAHFDLILLFYQNSYDFAGHGRH